MSNYVYKDDWKIEVFAYQASLIYWNRQVFGQKVAVVYAVSSDNAVLSLLSKEEIVQSYTLPASREWKCYLYELNSMFLQIT